MATHRENSFALLFDEESDDVSDLLARVSARVEQPQSHVAGPNSHSKTVPFSQYASSGRGRGRERGRGGPSRVSRSSSGNDVKQFGNGQPNGYRRSYGGENSNQWSFRGADGYQRNNGGGNGYRRDHGGANGFNQNYKVEGNQELENRGEKGGFVDGGWERVTDNRNYNENRQLRNGNSSNGEGSQGYRTREGRYNNGREGLMNNRRSEEMNNNGTENELGANRSHGVNGGAEKSVPAISEVSQYVESEQEKLDRLAREADLEKKAREEEEERKKMTLEQYEKLLVEKRKALEATKVSERKVNIDKDFESMHLVEKKKEDGLCIKLKGEKDKLERKESIDKDEKVHKVKARQLPLDEVFRIRRTPRGGWRGDRDRGRGDAANMGRGRGDQRGTNGTESDTGHGHSEQAGYRKPQNTGRGRGEQGKDGPESDTGCGPLGQAGYRNSAGTGRGDGQPSSQGRGHGEQVGYRGGFIRRRVAVPAIGDSRQFPCLGKATKE